MSRYDKWINKNTHLLTNQLAIVIGATGSIGKEIVDYLLTLKAKVIIGARNLGKAEALKNQLLLKHPDAKIYIEHIDISSLESIDKFQLEVDRKYQKADIFINNSGVYHLQKSLSNDGYEMHFATNTLGNYYLAKKIIYDLKENAKMIFVSSLAANFYKINFSDFQSLHTKNKMKVYGISKRIMMANAITLKNSLENSSIDVNIAHPGICATELFTKSHSKLFNIFIYPLMKIVFHSPKKAALNMIQAIFVETEENEWVAPRGLFGAWGYPKVLRFKKIIYDASIIEQVSDITADMISRHCEKK